MPSTETYLEANRMMLVGVFDRAAARFGKNNLARGLDGVAAALSLQLSARETEDFIADLERAPGFARHPTLQQLPNLAREFLYAQSL